MPENDQNVDKSRLSWWYPRLQSAGLNDVMPRTTIIPYQGADSPSKLLDGVTPEGWQRLVYDVGIAVAAEAEASSWPVFLRHDLFSGKHGYAQTCKIASLDQVSAHMTEMVVLWHMENWFASGGDDVWCVREWLTIKRAVWSAFAHMPIGRERRYIVEDGRVADHFPYWPVAAIEWGSPERVKRAIGSVSDEPYQEIFHLTPLAIQAGKALGGSWSIDFMETTRGWFLIDCALADESWKPSDEDREGWREAIALANTEHTYD